MSHPRLLHVAIPCLNEADYLPATIDCLLNQSASNFRIWICVNQPEKWWKIPEKKNACINNRNTINYLKSLSLPNLHILDYSSPGKGWDEKNHGVGQARKVLMDTINEQAWEDDLIVSLDADTQIGENYLASVDSIFQANPEAMGLSNPYYHKLSGNDILDRAMLRYEIYMRHYAINMWRIRSPYSFTALGSAIALPVKAYRKIGGITPKKSGEDFYLLQKLKKAGRLINYNEEMVFPGTRFSDRVFFGTGPALIKGSQGIWDSYPVYHHALFEKVKTTCDLFPLLFEEEHQTPMSDFLKTQFKENDFFAPLRKNSKTKTQFVKACHYRVDGLRILQFLKASQSQLIYTDEKNLVDFFTCLFKTDLKNNNIPLNSFSFITDKNSITRLTESKFNKQAFLEKLNGLSFKESPVEDLDLIRNLQFCIEQLYQKNNLPDASLN